MAVRVLGGRYELVAFVGRGGMGEVWEGRDRVIERRVAVKLLPHDRRDTSGAELFFREARTAGGLSHAGVVTVFDLGQDPDDGTLYLVMEYLTGRDLDTVLREDGPPEVATATDWAAQTAAALHVAHRADVVHRDLKPANLMLGPDGRITILDFGVARYMAATHKSSKVIGTLAYMPPERFGDLPGDARSDLYSLGCVLHELLTGDIPFQATGPVAMMAAHLHREPVPPGDIRSGVPAALDDLVLALLAKNPDHRPANAAEVHGRLRELPAHTAAHTADTTVVTPVHRPPVDPPQRRRVTRRTALRLGIGAAAAAGVTTALALTDTDSSRVRWRRSVSSGLSSPAVVDGAVYVGSAQNLYALSAATGAKKWDFGANSPLSSAPAVADGVVYAGSYGNLHALNAATGAKKWKYATMRRETSAALVTAGTVYFSDYRSMHAIDAATGAKKWEFDTYAKDDIRADVPHPSPAVAAGTVYFGGTDNNVYALDAATGATNGAAKWVFAAGDAIHSSPAVADGLVYVGCNDNNVYALDAATGAKKWTFATGGDVYSTPAIAGGVLYIGSADNNVYALDAATGAKKWVFAAGDAIHSSPAVADGVVYIGCDDKKLYALDAATGAPRWAFTTSAPGALSPVVVDKVVYLCAGDDVYALDTT
ncbi:serine/threonine-protein kinase (plasmid) [Embleya sp. NBC_00888]|uniref:outer membrane protein assembly factor BamB family protein n=1 Tax=Embleya sp. NBC_00888 TaxID=2975960 RepID=UPI002F912FC4|nr:serine/threonine-protein kinase [Embleya sp. NBC_00888]